MFAKQEGPDGHVLKHGWKTPHNPPDSHLRVDTEGKGGDGSQNFFPWRHMVFPQLLKSAEIRLEVIAGMFVSSEEPGNYYRKLPRRLILSGGCGWGVTGQAVL